MAIYTERTPFQGSLDFTPYNLPNDVIMNAVKIKTAYYEDGIRRGKSAYDNAVDFDLINDQQRVRLSQMKVGLDESMKKAAKTDLSISDNQQLIFDAVKPIVSDSLFNREEQMVKKQRSSLQEAEITKNKKGIDYVNSDSIEAIARAMSKWKNANPSDIDNYESDYFGTMYQAYDPNLKLKHQKEYREYMKMNMVEKEIPDPSNKFRTKKIKEYAITPSEARNFYLQSMPEQDRIRLELKSRNELDRKLDAVVTDDDKLSINNYYKNLKDSIVGVKIKELDNLYSEYEINENLALLDDTDRKKLLEGKKKEIDDAKTSLMTKYNQQFEDDAYTNPLKISKARLQASDLLRDYEAETFVRAVGIDNKSYTYGVDKAEVEKQKMALLSSKVQNEANKDKTNPQSSQENTFDGTGVVTTALPDVEEEGKSIHQQIATEPIKKKVEVINTSLGKIGVTVTNENGDGNVGLMDELSKNMDKPFSETLKKLNGGNELIKSILHQYTGGNVDKNYNALTNGQVWGVLTSAFKNKSLMNDVIKKAVVDKGVSIEQASEFVKTFSLQETEEINNELKYKSTYENAFKQAGFRVPKSFDEMVSYNSDTFFKNEIEPQLVQSGLTKEQIEKIKESKGDDRNSFERAIDKPGELFINVMQGLGKVVLQGITMSSEYNNPGLIPMNNTIREKVKDFDILKNNLQKSFDRYESFEKNRNILLGRYVNTAVNNKIRPLEVVDYKFAAGKDFNPNFHLSESDVQVIVSTGLSAADPLNGTTEKKNTIEKLKNLGTSVSTVFNKVIGSTGPQGSYISLVPNTEKLESAGVKAALKNADLSIDDITQISNMKLSVTPSVASKYINIPLNNASINIQKNKLNGGDLISGKKFTFRNIGMGEQQEIDYTGSFMGIRFDASKGVFQIKEEPLTHNNLNSQSFFNAYQINEKAFSLAANDSVLNSIYRYDTEATIVKSILEANKINTNEPLLFSNLPENVKEQLKLKVLEFQRFK